MIKDKLKLLPTNPGCYLMKNESNQIIYVGKAKNLKNRVSSYFNTKHTGKTAVLVSNIKNFEYIITNSEKEALLLEINLIKKYEPKYNIIFRDDKFYPYIQLTNEKNPKLIIIRPKNIKNKKDGRLFGPYPNVTAARTTINLLNRIYPLRKCDKLGKKVCLYYHLGECQGYCENKKLKVPISDIITSITSFLNGDHREVTSKLIDEMNMASNILNYEKAAELKELLDYINITLNKQKIDLNDYINRDVINYYSNNNYISIQIFYLRGGMITTREGKIYPLSGNIIDEVTSFIVSFYEKKDIPKEIFVNSALDINMLSDILNTKVISPRIGKKKSLLQMVYENAKIVLEEKEELIVRNEKKTIGAFDELGKTLGINNLKRVEIFDNSQLFGKFCVSGMVVFTDGKPNPKEYRKYKINTGVIDDYHQMKEVIYRRYFRVLRDNLVMPELVIVDGGVAQMNAALEVIKNLNLNINVLGLRKNSKHQTDGLIYKNKEIELLKNSDLFFLLTRMQDEVHRFTINYHRDIRSKSLTTSVLDSIPGLGKKRIEKLLKHYGSINNIKNANAEELSKIIPINIVNKIKEKKNNE